MDLFEDEEDRQHRVNGTTLSTSAPPFPFLRLPRELRDLVYSHALIRPDSGPHDEPTDICYLHHSPSSRHFSTSYWGTEKSTRLFRVNHQIYSEASEIFYATFSFYFPPIMDTTMIHDRVNILNGRCRALIRKIGFMLPFRGVTSTVTSKAENRMAQAFMAATRLLPKVTQVEVNIAIVGPYLPERQIMETVERILEILTLFKDVPRLIIRGGEVENTRPSQILKEVRQALAGQWKVPVPSCTTQAGS